MQEVLGGEDSVSAHGPLRVRRGDEGRDVRMDRQSVEILAPAGNIECARAALNAGADAIYLGYSSFSARAGAENFGDDELKEIVREAHLYGAKVYAAMNTLVKDGELSEFISALLKVWNAGADAIIMQDIFLGRAVKSAYPEIELHLSTQAGVCNENGALFAKKCGFSRVILARETKIEDIKKIAKIIETEAFVQGALCTCFSGQCYFSSFAGGLSGNRGRCKQPCRKKYAYDRAGAEKGYALSLSDLSLGEAAKMLAEAGVKSFKIEGRMRRKEYVAAATLYYDKIFCGAEADEISNALSDLKRAYNRGNYTAGLAFGQDKRFLSPFVQGHIGEKIGVVKVVNGKYFVETRENFSAGDAFKILRDKKEVGGAVFAGARAGSGVGSGIGSCIASGGGAGARGIYISSKERLKNGDGAFVTTDTKAFARVLSARKKRKICLKIRMNAGEYGEAKCGGVSVKTAAVLGVAENRALTESEIADCFKKTDGLPFEVSFSEIRTNNAFLPKSLLNAFRRDFYAALSARYAGERREKLDISAFAFENAGEKFAAAGKFGGLAVMARKFSGAETGVKFAIAKPEDYSVFFGGAAERLRGIFGDLSTEETAEKYLYYPAYATGKTEDAIAAALESGLLDGIYAENYSGAEFAEKHGAKLIFGTGANVTNAVAAREILKLENLAGFALSKEISAAEQRKIAMEIRKINLEIAVFALNFGNIKTMDLCYCPFGKTCSACDKRDFYTLTDENERKFFVRRYKDGLGECRFEIFNCAYLAGGAATDGIVPLIDCTCEKDAADLLRLYGDAEKQKAAFKNYTFGHAKNSVL